MGTLQKIGNVLFWTATTFMFIGGINWVLVGLLGQDIFSLMFTNADMLFEGFTGMFSRVILFIAGLSTMIMTIVLVVYKVKK